MVGGKASTVVFYAAVALFGAFAALFLTDFAVVRSGFCAPSEIPATCTREWLSSLSGWAAAAAAVGSIIYLRYEQKRRELLVWRKVVNSAAFVLAHLEPQLDALAVLKFDEEDRSISRQFILLRFKEIIEALELPQNEDYSQETLGLMVLKTHSLRNLRMSVQILGEEPLAAMSTYSLEMEYCLMAIDTVRQLARELRRVTTAAFNPRDVRGF